MAPVPKKTMVCVTVQKTCERLIREGARYAAGADLSVIHVVRNGAAVLGAGSDGEALDYLYGISRTYGAQMDILRSDDVVSTLAEVARKRGIELLVMGMANGHMPSHFETQLRSRLPTVKIVAVP